MGTPAEAAAMLNAIADRLSNLQPIMEVVAADVRTFVDDRFASGTDVDGVAFKALSHTTETISPRRIGGRPLNDTTRLRRSFTTRTNPRGFTFGSNVVYAAAQNFGNPANRVFGKASGPIPARPFLPVTPSGLDLAPLAFWDRQREVIAHWVRTGEVLP
jgi:phage gpG-like protein